jgi:predicted N-formylglutamate amidohydrolase
VLVCEHATPYIPASFENLGLSAATTKSHAAWDPGAMAVARHLSETLDAVLIAATVSRLVYDCNRPPDAPDAMPARSEVIDIPGNHALTPEQKATRIATCYEPFRKTLADRIALTRTPVIVTVHSFTPVFHGEKRTVEIGVLHDCDARLADAMIDRAAHHTRAKVQRNQPYGPEHGVTHTLKEHATRHGHLNVMLEIRNDLITTAPQQHEMAAMLAVWIADALAQSGVKGAVQCSV